MIGFFMISISWSNYKESKDYIDYDSDTILYYYYT